MNRKKKGAKKVRTKRGMGRALVGAEGGMYKCGRSVPVLRVRPYSPALCPSPLCARPNDPSTRYTPFHAQAGGK